MPIELTAPTNFEPLPVFLPTDEPVSRLRNQLLSALLPDELAAVQPHLEQVFLEQSDRLFDDDGSIRFVFFPESAVISLINVMRDGRAVEVCTVGREGMAGLPVFLGGRASSVNACVHIAGAALRMKADAFAQLASIAGPLHDLMLRYTHAFLTQVTQTAACNGVHLVQERCARLLLMTSERVDSSELLLTHEFLAFMLGVRRAGVTLAMETLKEKQLIQYRRGRVEIIDREGLEQAACECYETLRMQYVSLLDTTTPQTALFPPRSFQ
jgi:CRP-like cAMP-binding protein